MDTLIAPPPSRLATLFGTLLVGSLLLAPLAGLLWLAS